MNRKLGGGNQTLQGIRYRIWNAYFFQKPMRGKGKIKEDKVYRRQDMLKCFFDHWSEKYLCQTKFSSLAHNFPTNILVFSLTRFQFYWKKLFVVSEKTNRQTCIHPFKNFLRSHKILVDIYLVYPYKISVKLGKIIRRFRKTNRQNIIHPFKNFRHSHKIFLQIYLF